MTEATCMRCGTSYELPVVEADTPDEAVARLERQTRFPMCRDCWSDWDMNKCPDGEDHEWSFIGHGSFPDDDQALKLGECRRCGTGYLSEL